MIKKGFLLASFAIGVFANIFAQDTLSFKKTRDKNIYVEFLGSSNLIGVSFDSRFTPISPWGYRLGVSYFQGGDSFIKASNLHIPADTRSAFPVISVQSPVSIQCCWQS